jgi:hypothetical protein
MSEDLKETGRVLIEHRITIRDPDETPESVISCIPWQHEETKPSDT